MHVVGESYRQPTLEHIALFATTTAEPHLADLKGKARSLARKNEKRWFQPILLREFDNPYDTNAVAVHAAGYGLVGYLDRQTAIDYAPVFAELDRQGGRSRRLPCEAHRRCRHLMGRDPCALFARSCRRRSPSEPALMPPRADRHPVRNPLLLHS